MSRKISDAQIAVLKEKEQELLYFQEELKEVKDDQQSILDGMDEAARNTMTSSSNSARNKRSKSNTKPDY